MDDMTINGLLFLIVIPFLNDNYFIQVQFHLNTSPKLYFGMNCWSIKVRTFGLWPSPGLVAFKCPLSGLPSSRLHYPLGMSLSHPFPFHYRHLGCPGPTEAVITLLFIATISHHKCCWSSAPRASSVRSH